MSRKRLLISLGLIALVLCTTAAVLTFLVRHEPTDYRALKLEEGPERKRASVQFTSRAVGLLNAIDDRDPTWSTTFTQDQINSYLQEDFEASGFLELLQENGLSDPRVSIDPDHIRIAMCYGEGFWQSVVTLEVKLWLTQEGPNVVALELLSFKAGSLPLPPQWLLEAISDATHKQNIECTWYRHEGHPVALLRFQADQVQPTIQLQQVLIEPGRIYFAGQSLTSAGEPITSEDVQ